MLVLPLGRGNNARARPSTRVARVLRITLKKFEVPIWERKMDKRGSFASALGVALALAVWTQAARADDRKDHDGDRGHQKLLKCDDSLKNDFHPDSLTSVLLVKAFKQGRAHAWNAGADDADRRRRRLHGQAAGRAGQPGAGRRALDLAWYRHRSVAAGTRQLEQPHSRHGRRRLGGR